MRTFFDCIPCFVKQTLAAVRMSTDDEALQESILREALQLLSGLAFDQSPPHMAREIHQMIRARTGNADPYAAVKEQFNTLALEMLPALRKTVHASDDPFDTALRMAIAGNIVDFGVGYSAEDIALAATVEEVLTAEFPVDERTALRERLKGNGEILYLLDNTGEVALDRLFIEEALPTKRVTAVAKKSPVINDATRADAAFVGLMDVCEVIDNGADAPGTILDLAPPAFRERFEKAEMIIAKGQGNYETLSNCEHPGIFFLLKAKCPVIATDLGCEVGDVVVARSTTAQE